MEASNLLKTLLLILALSLSSAGKQLTLRIPLEAGETSEQVAVVTFDDSRVSATDVKRWTLLHENGVYERPAFGFYPGCKASDTPKLQRDIARTQTMVEELDPNRYPPELSSVVMYLKDLQSLWLWLGRQELEFLKSGKPPENEYKDTSLERCQVHTETIPKAQACHQIFFNWHNCVNDTMRAKLGSYPKQQWKAFLDAYGIQERVKSTVND
jgi:hypothetical protein